MVERSGGLSLFLEAWDDDVTDGKDLIEGHDGDDTLTVTAEGFADAVVWNPGPEKCAKLPDMDPETFSLMSILPLQILSYRMSIGRGYDPDFPRNLSKTLTVD